MSSAGSHDEPGEILLDLLIKQHTEGLSRAEQAQLDMSNGQRRRLSNQVEHAIAAIHLASGSLRGDAPPPALRERLESQAQAFFAGKLAGDSVAMSRAARSPAANQASLDSRRRRGSSRRRVASQRSGVAGRSATRRFAVAGWSAAAACLVLAISGWLRTPRPASPLKAGLARTAAGVGLSLAQQRAALLARGGGVTMTLNATGDQAAAGVRADVVWDGTTQRGFIRFFGLRPNDPGVSQYQAWIFDGQRDQRYPVAAGVFDVDGNAAELIVPIHAALPIASPKAFAVTVERPGGVVVSALEHVVVLGSAT